MVFIIITFFTALAIESIGTFISVLGLAAVFNANPIIMTMAVVLDLAKLTTVSFLYKKWKSINSIMKTYMMVASIVLMTITSVGAFGYLSSEFQKAVIPNKESAIKIASLEEEKARAISRKAEIDAQIAKIPPNVAVRNRLKLMSAFKTEQEKVTARVAEIDNELPKLKIANAGVSAHIGPIAYVAEAFHVSMEEAIKWVILLIIFVFDPLAISLILAGNFLIEEYNKKKSESILQPTQIAKEPELPKPVEQIIEPEQQSETIQSTEVTEVAEEVTSIPGHDVNLEIEIDEPVISQEVEVFEEPKAKIKTDRQLEKLVNRKLGHAKSDQLIPLELVEPEVTEPEVTEPEVTEPEVTEPEVTEPEVTEPEVTEPEVTEPEVTEPEVTEPEVTEPEVTEDENHDIINTISDKGILAGSLHVSGSEVSFPDNEPLAETLQHYN